MQTFANWIALAENEAARLAVERVADCVCGRGPRRAINPLFLYGPAGSGKSHLVSALLAEATRRAPDLQAALLPAGDFEALVLCDAPPTPTLPHKGGGKNEAPSPLVGEGGGRKETPSPLVGEGGGRKETPSPLVGEESFFPSALVGEGWGGGLKSLRQAELLIIEDVQHLPARVEETFVHLMDRGLARGQQLVYTALAGPAQLSHLPARVTSRLGSGLVVGLGALSPDSRRVFLQERIQRRGLTVSADVIAWLAEHLTGSVRQLEGAVARLAELTRLHGQILDVQRLAEDFAVEAAAHRPTVERIAQRVGCYFHVEPRQLQARSRTRGTLLPRQVGMYLARQLTELSLQQIGAYFGGRDHSTVLHACRKVEKALAQDMRLFGAVRQLHADLA